MMFDNEAEALALALYLRKGGVKVQCISDDMKAELEALLGDEGDEASKLIQLINTLSQAQMKN